MLPRLRIYSAFQVRWFSGKVELKICDHVNEMFEKEEVKPRKHPGILYPGIIKMPENILDAIRKAVEDHPVKAFEEESRALFRHLHGRHPPCEQSVYKEKYEELQQTYFKNVELDELLPEQAEKLLLKNRNKALRYLKDKIHNWQPLDYNARNSKLYLLGRGMADYAVLYKIFHEIKLRDKDYSPEMIFDFGSGVGTAMWAVGSIWEKPPKEYFAVDISGEMIDLSEKIVKSAFPNNRANFFRQYFPLSLQPHYDLVVSAYSLFELPNSKERINTIYKLWKKTRKYLVIVEQGTNAGFNLVSEARDFINYISQQKEKEQCDAHIFSPCTHELECPTVAKNDGRPCSFETIYETLPFFGKAQRSNEIYSYVVFRKGERFDENWPRIVRPVLLPSKRAICRLCIASGKLQEIIVTKLRHGKHLHRCAKASDWGDRLPIEIKQVIKEESDVSTNPLQTKQPTDE